MTLVHIHKLPSRQQHAIPALLAHPTIKGAAAQIGVNQVTLLRWLAQPAFDAAYREARYVVMDEAFRTLQKATIEAAQTIIEVMRDADANPFVRLHAAQSVLENAAKSRAIAELEARIAALEQEAEDPVPPTTQAHQR